MAKRRSDIQSCGPESIAEVNIKFVLITDNIKDAIQTVDARGEERSYTWARDGTEFSR